MLAITSVTPPCDNQYGKWTPTKRSDATRFAPHDGRITKNSFVTRPRNSISSVNGETKKNSKPTTVVEKWRPENDRVFLPTKSQAQFRRKETKWLLSDTISIGDWLERQIFPDSEQTARVGPRKQNRQPG